MNPIEQIKELLVSSPNMTNFGRMLRAQHPVLHAEVLKNARAPDSASFNEQLYLLVNDLQAPPLCPLSGEPLRFINWGNGYRKISGKAVDTLPKPAADGVTSEDIAILRQASNTLSVKAREFIVSHIPLCARLMKTTETFGDATFVERVYCVLNGMATRPTATFLSVEKGYLQPAKPREPDAELVAFAQLVGNNSSGHGSKVKALLKRNRIMNASLYELSEEREGIDFVVCPVLRIRTLNLKRAYVQGVLLMSMDDFKQKYPDCQLTCAAHAKSLSDSLKVEVEPGLTRHALSVIKATEVRAEIGEDGLSINARKGRKIRQTHLESIDENGLNGYQRLARYRNETYRENGLTIQQDSLHKRDRGIANYGASALSKRALAEVITFLDEAGIKYYFDAGEYCVRVKSHRYFYDLVIPEIKLCVEYQSRAYHPNPVWDEERWASWRPVFGAYDADEKFGVDLTKAKTIFRERGICMWFIYQDSEYEDAAMLLEFIKSELKNVSQKQSV